MSRLPSESRRQQILQFLQEATEPVPARDLGERYGVSRQVIVQDITVLRAAGHAILATASGYIVPRQLAARPYQQVVAVRHRPEDTATELYALAEVGVRVVDVVVDHPLYGELRGMLMLESRGEVDRFMERLRQQRVTLLSSLTGGLHMHTLEAVQPDQLRQARERLAALGFLVTEESLDPADA